MNAQSNPLLSLSRNNSNKKRKYSDAMQDKSYERSNIITDVNPVSVLVVFYVVCTNFWNQNQKRKRFKKH